MSDDEVLRRIPSNKIFIIYFFIILGIISFLQLIGILSKYIYVQD